MKSSEGRAARRRPSRKGEQLELELAGPGLVWLEPWEGKSPRTLTGAYKRFSLGAPPARGLPDDEKLAAQNEQVPLDFREGPSFQMEVRDGSSTE